jgi:hypothetical protein
LAEAGIEQSAGRAGGSYDNALAGTTNGLYKAKVMHRRGPVALLRGPGFRGPGWNRRSGKVTA